MFSVFLLCGCFVWANCYLKEVDLPTYFPPSQDLIPNKYFRSGTREFEAYNRDKKAVSNDFQKDVDSRKKNVLANATFSSRERYYKNALKLDRKKPLTQVGKVTRLKVSKRPPPIPVETTTVKYPTATYSVERYEKLKAFRKNLLKRPVKPSPILKPPLFAYESPDSRVKRGKTKWKDTKLFSDSEHSDSHRFDYRKLREEGSDFLDKYLEEALMRYLMTLNLKEDLGNVSVKTFTEILKNVTGSKPTPRISPYDRNRSDVYSIQRNDNKSNPILEKSPQTTTEERQDFKLDETTVGFYTRETSTREAEKNANALSTEFADERTTTDGSNDFYTTKTAQVFTEKIKADKNESEVKLSVAETVYYKKRHFPARSLIFEQDKSGVIPGAPELDYPMYSNPPLTGFKCPDMKGSKRPRMMADTKARCQVFYICTGDGPAAVMLCPNGTMFNENVLVCDWWYNVDC